MMRAVWMGDYLDLTWFKFSGRSPNKNGFKNQNFEVPDFYEKII